MALPFLEVMLPRRAQAQAPAPKRYVICFAGMALGKDGRGNLRQIVPDRTGFDYDVKVAMQPLAAAGVANEVSVVSGLEIPVAMPGKGSRPVGFHKATPCPLLSGVSNTLQSPTLQGPSSCWLVSEFFRSAGVRSKFPYLPYRIQLAQYRGNDPNALATMWRSRGASGRVDPIFSPSRAFADLFGTGSFPTAGPAPSQPTPGTPAPDDLARRERKSVVDAVLSSAERLRRRLGRADQLQIERHFDELRQLELRIAGISSDAPAPGAGGSPQAPVQAKLVAGCKAPPQPGADPERQTIGQNGYSGEEQRAQVFMQLVAKAFACDLSRVGSIMFTATQCFMDVSALVGVRTDLHELGHSVPSGLSADQAQLKFMEMYAWHMKHFAALISQLKAERDVDGRPVLDNTVLVFVNEGGYGRGEGKTNVSHSSENMIALVAGGRGLGLRPGQHVRATGSHPAQAIISAMSAVGMPGRRLGEVEGRIEALFTG